MSFNLNVDDDFYGPNPSKQHSLSGGQAIAARDPHPFVNSQLDFANSSNYNNFNNSFGQGGQSASAGGHNQFYDPGAFFNQAPQHQSTFYNPDWSQPQQDFYNPQAYAAPERSDYGKKGSSNGGFGNMQPAYQQQQQAGTDFENEPPLLEELGINFDHIYRKTRCVLNPFSKPHESIIHDEDLAGPLVFCIAYGFSLLLMGKIHFGYIYGITALGCLCMYSLLNLMLEKGISVICVSSTLGYCLLPMVILSFLSIVIPFDGVFKLAVSLLFILWCSVSASNLFVYSHNMSNQQILVLYPCFLLYGIFALLNAF